MKRPDTKHNDTAIPERWEESPAEAGDSLPLWLATDGAPQVRGNLMLLNVGDIAILGQFGLCVCIAENDHFIGSLLIVELVDEVDGWHCFLSSPSFVRGLGV